MTPALLKPFANLTLLRDGAAVRRNRIREHCGGGRGRMNINGAIRTKWFFKNVFSLFFFFQIFQKHHPKKEALPLFSRLPYFDIRPSELMKGPLSTLKVLDFTRLLPGPLCTHLLTRLGAQVVKVDAPEGGDYTRHMGPMLK